MPRVRRRCRGRRIDPIRCGGAARASRRRRRCCRCRKAPGTTSPATSGCEELDDAVAAANAGRTRSSTRSMVNDTWFINNSSIGVYPRLVAHREARETRSPKGVAAIVAAWHQLRAGRRLAVSSRRRAGGGVGRLRRQQLLRRLAPRAHRATNAWTKACSTFASPTPTATSRGCASSVPCSSDAWSSRTLIDRQTCTSIVLDTGRVAHVALDGEVVTMGSPLHYEVQPACVDRIGARLTRLVRTRVTEASPPCAPSQGLVSDGRP